MGIGAREGQALQYNIFDKYFQDYLRQLGPGVQGILGGLMDAYEPHLKDIMGEYYGTAAVLGQAVPGQGFSGKARGGLERTLADFGSNLAGQALQAYAMPYQGIFGSSGQVGSSLSGQSAAKSTAQSGQWMGLGGSALGAVGTVLGSVCCFIFIEANNGVLDRIARRYRDEHGTADQRVGYKKIARWLVPLMKRSSMIKSLVKWLMVKPMITAGKAFYKENRWGYIFYPFLYGWLKLFEMVGKRHIRGVRKCLWTLRKGMPLAYN
jgi:hypothetical protein